MFYYFIVFLSSSWPVSDHKPLLFLYLYLYSVWLAYVHLSPWSRERYTADQKFYCTAYSVRSSNFSKVFNTSLVALNVTSHNRASATDWREILHDGRELCSGCSFSTCADISIRGQKYSCSRFNIQPYWWIKGKDNIQSQRDGSYSDRPADRQPYRWPI